MHGFPVLPKPRWMLPAQWVCITVKEPRVQETQICLMVQAHVLDSKRDVIFITLHGEQPCPLTLRETPSLSPKAVD